MGEVYLAEHARIDRRAAIKVLLPELSHDQDVVDALLRRGARDVVDPPPGHRRGPRLRRSPERARVHRDGAARGREPGCAAWRASRGFGRNERTALRRDRGRSPTRSPRRTRKGIVHRDLKPDNIFLAGDRRRASGFAVKILDFGIAKLLGSDHRLVKPEWRARAPAALLGTPVYMSPEQCRGAGRRRLSAPTSTRSAASLFELLAGRPPFVYEGFGELISAHIGEKPAALQTLRPQVSPSVAAFVARLLEKDPARRPQTMEAAGQEIASLLARLPARGSELELAANNATTPWARRPAVLAGAGGTGPGGTLLAEPGNLGGTSQTTLSEMATEEVRARRSRRGGRAKIRAPILVIGLAGGVAGVVVYQHQTPHESLGDSKGPSVAVAAPAAAIVGRKSPMRRHRRPRPSTVRRPPSQRRRPNRRRRRRPRPRNRRRQRVPQSPPRRPPFATGATRSLRRWISMTRRESSENREPRKL